MLLPLWKSDELVPTRLTDPAMLHLADRHYSRTNHASNKLGGPSRSLLLRNVRGTILFLWQWPYDDMRRDKQNGFNCAMFRNESSQLSSTVILDAESAAFDRWGPNRCFTYVDPKKLRSSNPGYCFKVAGYVFVGVSASGKHLLVKEQIP